MAQFPSNVLRVNAAEEAMQYRDAVRQVLVNIQSETGLTLHEIAETIGASVGTISNAANRKDSLGPMFLSRLGEAFGPSTLDPWAKISGARMIPLEPTCADPLPSLTGLVFSIVEARQEGGSIKHPALLAMMPKLRAVQASVTDLILQAERISS